MLAAKSEQAAARRGCSERLPSSNADKRQPAREPTGAAWKLLHGCCEQGGHRPRAQRLSAACAAAALRGHHECQ